MAWGRCSWPAGWFPAGFHRRSIGFAFRDVLQNLLAGILILLTRPFVIGDQIEAGDHEGTVEDVWVPATVLRTYDNQRVLIPNATLFVDKITVVTAHDRRRLAFPVTTGNGDDIGQAKRIIVEALRASKGVLADQFAARACTDARRARAGRGGGAADHACPNSPVTPTSSSPPRGGTSPTPTTLATWSNGRAASGGRASADRGPDGSVADGIPMAGGVGAA